MRILFLSHFKSEACWVIIGFDGEMNGANINKIHNVIFFMIQNFEYLLNKINNDYIHIHGT